MVKSNAIMLPPNVRPVKYALTLEPDLVNFTFRGEESVDIEVVESTSSITLNSIEIAIQSCELVFNDGTRQPSSDVTFDESQETVAIEFDSEIPTGIARLNIQFTGDLNDKLRGFYRSKYTDVNGRERYLASTQFEATDARRAFPCWDEPPLKATFDVTLVIPSKVVAISNMPIANETEARPGYKAVRFEETPIMSTYLLAFIVGDLRSVGRHADDGTLIRVWATRGNEKQGHFALDTSIKMLAYFNQYFGIPYPLPKLDHLAVPDFAAGAMENWGAITYRETTLLVDEKGSSAGTRQLVAGIIAHEMAHMWFGDLVTMMWWDDLWLNESFASWMGDKATDHLFPEWDMWTQFLTSDTNRGLSLDGLKNSHPIEQEVANPDEIGQLFDAISYSKGASILRMLEQFLGEDVFQSGLHSYLTRNAYENARTQDLWNSLGEASGQPVGAIMDTWVKQTGYPVIDVEATRLGDGVDLALSQGRFLYESILGQNEPDTTLWQVPVTIQSAYDSQTSRLLMDGALATARLKTASSGATGDWLKLNPLQTGFYRVKYSSEELNRLSPPIRNRVLPPADRIGMQNDTYALSRAGYVPATEFLRIADAYTGENDASVCADLADNLAGIDSLLWDQPYYSKFSVFARRIFQPTGSEIGWDAKPDEGHLDTLLRSIMLAQLGRYGDDDTLNEASTRYKAYSEDPSNVSPDIRGVVLSLAAKRGDGSTHEAMWDQQKQAERQEEKVRFLISLTRFRQPTLLQRTLDLSLTPDIRHQDAITMISMTSSNRYGQDLAWEFLKDNWDEYDRRYGEGGFALMRLVSIPSGFATAEKYEDVDRFFTDHPTPGAERSIRQTLEQIKLNTAWLERNRSDLAAWFAD